ncbi:hypothetical protein ACFVRV_06265 [Arthrobacter koreensis]|uniref:hypothetical protein n=1 Tax=Arthrobacter koreensis TaxID=199136 RepID=UPI0036DF7894
MSGSEYYGSQDHRKARKAHQCSTCRRRIDPGETYATSFTVWDGMAYRWKWCAHCEAVWSIWCPEDFDGMISEDGYDSWASDHARDLQELRNMVYYRQQWRRQDGNLHPIPTRPVGATTTTQEPTP